MDKEKICSDDSNYRNREFAYRTRSRSDIDSSKSRQRDMKDGGLYFAKTDSDKSENQYRNLLNRTLPNQESAKPESAKTHSGIC